MSRKLHTVLSHAQLLQEMGLSPRWLLRAERTVARRLPRSAQPPIPLAAPQLSPLAPENHVEADTTEADTTSVDSFVAPAQAVANTILPRAESTAERSGAIASLDWLALQQEVAACRACGLCAQRKQAVFGAGDEVAADWLLIGEGPGAEEDARGLPFVGPAGQLLDAMLAALNLKRGAGVYIANAVKCRPPENRTPEAAELAACAPFLQRQIALLKPKLIILLGRVAVQSVLGELSGTLGSLRGKVFSYSVDAAAASPIPVLVTYHPAYLLRNLPDKEKAWVDLCQARALMSTLL
ncbi:MAG: uracil-DNA glycosylase [Pseudomonadota bacterium]